MTESAEFGARVCVIGHRCVRMIGAVIARRVKKKKNGIFDFAY